MVLESKILEAQKEREASQSWHRVQDLWPRMLANDDEAVREWLVEAEKLVESFRETRALFLTSRVRVPLVVVDDYAKSWLVAPWVQGHVSPELQEANIGGDGG